MKLAKNYMIVFIIYLITILGTLYFVFLYNKANIFDYDNKIDMFVLDVSDYEKLKENINNYMYENENFVIGGAQIYKMLLPYCKKLYITQINKEFEGDVYFPSIDKKDWKISSISKGPKDENDFDYEYILYERV